MAFFRNQPSLNQRTVRLDTDISEFGWLIVGVVLVLSGLGDVVTPEIYGRVRMAGQAPLLEGWPVVLLGLAQMAVGALMVIRFFKNR